MDSELQRVDPDIARLIDDECQRQQAVLRMIGSENYASLAVLAATGSCLTNKYSEGYARRRYYQGQQNIDQVEELAVSRAKQLFGVEHANVQPYSGSPANMAVYYALLDPGDRVMGMSLPHGGHLTHGSSVSFSGRFYSSKGYPLSKETGRLDFDLVRQRAKQWQPKLMFCGASSYPRKLDFAAFAEIAQEVGAYLVADISHISGLCLAGLHPDPVPHCQVVTTTTHKLLRGPRGGMILCRAELASAIDAAVFPGLQGGPHNNTTAAIAVALHEAASPQYASYCRQVVANAKTLAAELLGHDFKLVTGGTDNHLVLLDLSRNHLSARRFAQELEKSGIIANYNKIPFDSRPAQDPSGLRLGTPALTSRGMKEPEMKIISRLIKQVADNIGRDKVLDQVASQIAEMCSSYPAPGITKP